MRLDRSVPALAGVWLALVLPAAVLVAGGLATTGLAAQQADSVKARPATIVGHVIDSTGAAIADAEVLVTRGGDSALVKTGKSNKRGNVVLRDIPAGGPYILTARKLGYGPARGEVRLRDGDTLYVDFELPPYAVALAPIIVKARRNRYVLTADDLKPKIYRNALEALAWRRKDMLGDPEWCSPPDSFNQPTRDRTRIKLNDRMQFYSAKGDEHLSGIAKRPWLDSIRFGSFFDDVSLPYVKRVYVNGIRADVPGDPIRTPARVLRETPSERIEEMRYVDCWDSTMPLGMQYSLFLVLKPPSREEQDSIIRTITQRREVWDSILRSLKPSK